MKAISKKEAEKLRVMRAGHRSPVRAEIEGMAAGDVQVLTKEEWTRSTQAPMHMLRQIEKRLGRKYTCQRLLDRSGWVIERVE
jgi:hypothetical protein